MSMSMKTIFLFFISVFVFQNGYSECTAHNKQAILGPVNSFDVPNLGSQQMTGGLSCVGSLSALSTNYIRYKAIDAPIALTHTDGVTRANITIRDTNKNIVQTGKEVDLSSFSLLSFFGGPDSNVPFTVTVNSTVGLKPGTYTGQLSIRWYYSVAALGIGIINLVRFESDGFVRYGNIVSSWGTGRLATIPITLVVTPDCRINTNNLNFGSSPLLNKFKTANSTVQVTCSAETPYSVGLSNGLNYSTTRRMKHQSLNNYIGYEIYKNTTTQRWGSEGSERWNSANATTNAGLYNATTPQTYSFTGKVVDTSSTIPPEGTYTDTLQIEVKF